MGLRARPGDNQHTQKGSVLISPPVIEKAFQSAPPELLFLKSQSYGRANLVLAWKALQSYSRDYKKAVHFRASAIAHFPQLRYSWEYIRLSLAIAILQWFGVNGYNTIVGIVYSLRGASHFCRNTLIMSSCSVYGVSTDEYVTEESPVNPQTVDAFCKAMVEREVKAIADKNFSPTFLRNASAFGASPRMCFDSLLNNLAVLAWTTKQIKLPSENISWYALVHVLDICKAIVCTLEAPRYTVHNQM